MKLSRLEFEFLYFVKNNAGKQFSQRDIVRAIDLSLGSVNKFVNKFIGNGLIKESDKSFSLTKKGKQCFDEYKVNNAIILAAGFSSRLAPITLNTPKPLVKVNGVRIIDTLIDALIKANINDITIVIGHKKECFDELLIKYPNIKFIYNPLYNETNNISSVFYALDKLHGTYICEADLIISNPSVIREYQYSTNYLGIYEEKTDDWCFTLKNKYIDCSTIGGENCYRMIGISYWNKEDSIKLQQDISQIFFSPGGKENFWDNVPLKICKKDFKIEINPINKQDITEIDNLSELIKIDSSYAK